MAINTEIEFDEQAFLWDFYDLFQNAEVVKKGDLITVANREARTGRSIARAKKDVVKPMSYKNFLQLRDSEPHLTLNKISANNVSVLNDLTNAQLSALVPYIKIYKTITTKKGERDLEFPFGDFTTFSSITDSVLDRGVDAGIKNITWADVGTNPANVGLSFKGQMTLFFQSFEAIFQTRNVGTYKLSFADLLDQSEALSSTITPSDARPATNQSPANRPKIKLEVGWSIPDDPGNVLNMADVNERLHGNRRSYILENLNQQININEEDGSLTLNIDFIASIEARLMSTQADILYIDESDLNDPLAKKRQELLQKNQQQYKKIKSKRSQLKKRQRELQDSLQQAEGDLTASPGQYTQSKINRSQNMLASIDKALEALNLQAKDYESRKTEIRSLAYRRVLNALRSDNFLSSAEQKTQQQNNLSALGKIRYFDISKSTVELYKDILKEASESTTTGKELLDQNKFKTDEQKKNIITDYKKEFTEERKKSLGELKEIIKKSSSKSGTATDNGEREGFLGWRGTSVPTQEGEADLFFEKRDGTRRIQYFFLGDLIEAVMEIIYKSPETNQDGDKLVKNNNIKSRAFYDEVKVMMGSLLYENPVTKKPMNIQIADIPVSFTYFNAWFYDNVVKRQLERYPLKSFLRDLCSKLVNNLLSPTRYGIVASRKPLRTVTQSLWIDSKSDLSKFWNDNRDNYKQRFNVEHFFRRQRGKSGIINKPTEFIYLYVVGGETSELANTGKLQRSTFNRSKNIPHYTIGNQTGLLKNIAFSRTQIPYKFEASLSAEASATRKNLLFQDKYDAQITLFGNAIFKPGMLLYVDPRTLGLGGSVRKPKNVLTDYRYSLGIGGYYRVVTVSNEISEDQFITTLTTTAELDLRDIRFILNKNK